MRIARTGWRFHPLPSLIPLLIKSLTLCKCFCFLVHVLCTVCTKSKYKNYLKLFPTYSTVLSKSTLYNVYSALCVSEWELQEFCIFAFVGMSMWMFVHMSTILVCRCFWVDVLYIVCTEGSEYTVSTTSYMEIWIWITGYTVRLWELYVSVCLRVYVYAEV